MSQPPSYEDWTMSTSGLDENWMWCPGGGDRCYRMTIRPHYFPTKSRKVRSFVWTVDRSPRLQDLIEEHNHKSAESARKMGERIRKQLMNDLMEDML